MIVAIDFDGTIVEHKYPEIGAPLPDAFRVMRRLVKAGHTLVLWTCRTDHPTDEEQAHFTEALDFVRSNGVPMLTPDEAPSAFGEEFPVTKVFANIYIDDRNIGGFLGWDSVEEEFFDEKDEA